MCKHLLLQSGRQLIPGSEIENCLHRVTLHNMEEFESLTNTCHLPLPACHQRLKKKAGQIISRILYAVLMILT